MSRYLARDYPGWWLSSRCGCGRRADFPVRLLGERYGLDADLGRVAARLRCEKCMQRAEEVVLVDRPDLTTIDTNHEPQRHVLWPI